MAADWKGEGIKDIAEFQGMLFMSPQRQGRRQALLCKCSWKIKF